MSRTRKIVINGIVQGVGFRPFIYNLAKKYSLNGFVSNTSEGVIIETNASDDIFNEFLNDIKLKKPPQSEISSIKISDTEEKNFDDFKIIKSISNDLVTTSIPADLAICSDCINDIFDSSNRRYLYPFTNCTNCGPRFSIIKKIPYDRKWTTMSSFDMCDECAEEYSDPLNRRFHAQPNACPRCGPRVWSFKNKKLIYDDEAINFIVDEIISNRVVLIKGIGGFHIAANPFDENAVKELRKIKSRDFKPFAIMVSNIDSIKNYVFISDSEMNLISSPKAPIVMLKKKNRKIFELVAPSLDSVGVMIAYTPLHRIIFKKLEDRGFKNPLVMTSANFKDEPLVKDNSAAKKLFSNYPVLYHNRDIHNRIDDSVLMVDRFNNIRITRRARGYVPNSINVNSDFKDHIFAAGADMKNCFAFYRHGEVIISQHIGDLEMVENRNFYIKSYKNFKKLFNFLPFVAVADMHPGYYSKQITEGFNFKKIFYVQHHISHIYSVMAENNIDDDIIGVAFDGVGYGLDGNIWGGEFFVIKNRDVKRAAGFNYFKLPGGDLCSSEIWRSFLSIFSSNRGFVKSFLKDRVDPKNVDIVFNMMDKNINSPLSSSVGRIFDAVSVLVTGSVISNFEAEGPMKIEALAYKKVKGFYDFDINENGGFYSILIDRAVDEMIYDYKNGRADEISARFHRGIVKLIKKICIKLSDENKIKNVAISGGVFQNKFLINLIQEEFRKSGLNIYLNSAVPSNDGGISLGQIYYYIKNISKLNHGNLIE